MMKRFAFRISILFLFTSSLFIPNLSAQSKNRGPISDSVGTFLIKENLQYFLGFGIEVVEKGEEGLSLAYGYATNEQMTGFTDSTIFNLGSVSKLFTSMAIVKLAHMQVIDLEDPVYTYFPEFLTINGKSKYAPQITLYDLLQHRSGIDQSMEDLYPELFKRETIDTEEEFYENTYNYRAFMSTEDFINRFKIYASLDHKPNVKYRYCNLGFVILGYIVEEVTKMNLAEFVTNYIFTPLEMHDSHYYRTPDSLEDRMAWGYYRLSDDSYLNIHQNEVESPSPTGDGGIKTTMRDMRKFMRYLIGEGDQEMLADKIFPRRELLSMMGPLQKGPDKKTYVGIGFHNLQPYNLTGHAGGWDGFLNVLYYHPDSHSCVFLTTNREDNDLFMFLKVYATFALLNGQF